MSQRDCFGSLREIVLDHGQTTTQAKPECRNCMEIRDCLRYSKQLAEEEKEKDELNKQNMITQIIDHSHIVSNEIGSCLLEFLSRLYSSPLGATLFKNLLLFQEIPSNSISSHLSISISPSLLRLLQGDQTGSEDSSPPQKRKEEEVNLRIILFQKSFPKDSKANMGMIAYEVARAVASDDLGIKPILDILPEVDRNLFKKMNSDRKTNWLIEKWGFHEEFEALKKEMATVKGNELTEF